MEGLGVME